MTERRVIHRASLEERGIANEPNFRVIEEGDGYVVVDKPAPLLVHPSTPGNPPTLQDGLVGLLAYELANGGQVSLINRLDRETSGIVLVAITPARAREFHMAMEHRRFRKRYQALCHGWPEWQDYHLVAPILRRSEIEPSPIWVKQIVHDDGAKCETGFRVLKRMTTADGGKMSLIEVLPVTGRMHQIRVHLAHLGHPIVGDKIYGQDETCYLDFIEAGWTDALAQRLILPRHALHSTYLALCEEDSEDLAFSWQSDFPAELISKARSLD